VLAVSNVELESIWLVLEFSEDDMDSVVGLQPCKANKAIAEPKTKRCNFINTPNPVFVPSS